MSNAAINTRVPSCSVSILTARCDIKFMQQTIPHLIRMCRYPFVERILHVDDPTLRGEYLTRPDIASAEEHYSICQRLLAAGIVDRVERIRYDRDTLVQTGKKHFGRVAPFTHDVHGYPIHGSAFCIDDVNTDYMVHFDCDMLLHSDPEFSWIAKGIELMEKHEDILFASPLAGPPSKHGTLKQDPDAKFRIDEAAGCYRFQTFTSRKFLVNRKRLSAHLPVPLVFTSVRQRLKSLFTRKSCLWNWEVMISKHL